MIDNIEEILKEPIHTKRLVLRKFTPDDCYDVLEYGSDKQTLEYLIWNGVSTLDDANKAIHDYYIKNPSFYAIELKENNKCIGCIDLRLELEHEKTSFGYVLNREYWNQGYMSETLSTIISLCFDKLHINRIESTHYFNNTASGKVMKKCGMKYEGTGIQEEKIKGIFHDIIHYGIIKQDWDKENKEY